MEFSVITQESALVYRFAYSLIRVVYPSVRGGMHSCKKDPKGAHRGSQVDRVGDQSGVQLGSR